MEQALSLENLFASQFRHSGSVSKLFKVHFCHHLNGSNTAVVTHPKSMHPLLRKAKIQNVGVERPKVRMTELEVKKVLLIKKELNREDRGSNPQIHLKKAQNSGLFLYHWKEKWGELFFVKTKVAGRTALKINMSQARAVSLKAMGTQQAERWSQSYLAFHCYTAISIVQGFGGK